jgi:hypothetical protein
MHLPEAVFVPDWGRHLMGTLNMALRQLRKVESKMLSQLNGTPKWPPYIPYEIHIEHLRISNHITSTVHQHPCISHNIVSKNHDPSNHPSPDQLNTFLAEDHRLFSGPFDFDLSRSFSFSFSLSDLED